MATPSRPIPVRLEIQFEEIARQYLRRERLTGWLKFGSVLLIALMLVGGTLALRGDWPFPVATSLIGLALLFVVSGWLWLYRPLRHRPTREQLALFLDEHHPELENLAISSVEFSQQGYEGAPEWMLERFFQDARLTARNLSFKALMGGAQLDRLSIGVGCVWLLVIAILTVLMMRVDLGHLRQGMLSWDTYEPIPFEVSPGDTRLRKGEDLVVWVTTNAPEETKAIRWRSAGADWQTEVLQASSAANVSYARRERLQADAEYQVQVGRRRSPIYRATVWEPPEVEAIHLTYRFPDYLERSPQQVPHAGHITVPEGSTVDIEIEVNKPLAQANLMLDDAEPLALKEASKSVWQGQMVVSKNDTYHIELQDQEDNSNEYQPEYRIVAKEDKAPEIRIKFPRGDDEATLLEEITFGFGVQDDYGLKGYGLQYEIAGRDSVRIGLGSEMLDQMDAQVDHLIALEDMALAVGDFIIWTVWAEDRKPDRAAFEMLGDPYFLEIRSFHRSFREALSNQGGQPQQQQNPMQGPAQGEAIDQKQLIIATWNLRKQARKLEEAEYEQRLNAIIEAQRDILGTAQQADLPSDAQRRLLEAIGAALGSLESATWPEPEGSLSEAIRHQQTAYRYLLQTAPEQAQVMQARSASSAGQQSSSSQRDLDALELTQRRDFREEATTLREQQAETEAARNQIEELAKRQGLINEDIAKLISEMETLEGTELEEAKRRLEQLEDEQQQAMRELDRLSGEIASGDLDARQARQAQQQLDDARQQMDRSARNLAQDQLQQARSAGNRALGALNEAEQELQQLSRGAAAQRMEELREQMEQIREQQEQITEAVHQGQDGEPGPPQPQRLDTEQDENNDLRQEKQGLASQFESMMEDASELAEKSEETQGRMARELGDWLRETAREGIYEDIQRGEQYIRYGAWDVARDHEEQISDQLAEAARRLDEVADHLVRDDLDAMQRAADELEELMAGTGENPDGQTGQPADPSADAGARSPGESARGRNLAWDGTRWDSGALRWFADDGYRDWLNRIRNAEDLLPEDDPIRERLRGIREDLDAMRRRFLRDSEPPRFDLVFDQAIKPLSLAAEELQRAIQEQQSEFVFGPKREAEVPAQYQARVAEYFKALSEME